jgi:protein-serine/threonine kinase
MDALNKEMILILFINNYSDVMSGNKKISLFVYDRGNKLSNGQDRFLGMSSIVLNLVNQKTVELIFPLVGRPNDDQEVTGNVRLQVTYSASRKVKTEYKKTES